MRPLPLRDIVPEMNLRVVLESILWISVFTVLLVPLVVSPDLFFPYITGKNIWFRVLTEIGFTALLALCLFCRAYRPRFSWILGSLLIWLGVLFVANTFGEYPPKSFWSNFERMEGFIGLVHVVIYFVLLSVTLGFETRFKFLGKNLSGWDIFLHLSIASASIVVVTALWQTTVGGGTTGWRVSGTLGNPTYMAVYMLFNIFFTAWLLFQSRFREWRYFYLTLITIFAFLLVQTATRGVIIGFSVGVVVSSLYLLLKSESRQVKKIASYIVATLFIVISLLAISKNSSFVQENLILQRATAISLDALAVRIDLWEVALAGVKERPWLGWGQENFNYVFNKYYDPKLANVERWYDRAHNVFLDWLVAAGVFGLLSYLSIFSFLVYYFLRGDTFSVVEKSLLLGITAAYFVQNLVVFDNLASYLGFVTLLALVHSRVAKDVAYSRWPTLNSAGSLVVTGVLAVVLIFSAIGLNAPFVQAGGNLIDALSSSNPQTKLYYFEEALAKGGRVQQEIVEQLMFATQGILANSETPEEVKKEAIVLTHEAVAGFLKEKTGDTRLHLFASVFYRYAGQTEEARRQIEIARELSPNKIDIIIEQAWTEYFAGDFDNMYRYMQEAYALNPDSRDAQINLSLGSLIVKDDTVSPREILSDQFWGVFVRNEMALSFAVQNKDIDLLRSMLDSRIEMEPQNLELWLDKALLMSQVGATEEALSVMEYLLEQSIQPELRLVLNCYNNNIIAGRNMTENCQ